ncbi:MAG: GntR family transcriptional regulator [Candidatus Aminicenantes bacterium]|jgi:GntR family transcriptional regulator
MLLNLTDLSAEPLQSQIIRQIRAKILTGELKADSDLPSIRRLARDQRISVITVQRAYEGLEREGLIHSRRGKGFFVSHLSDAQKKSLALERLKENLKLPLQAALSEGLEKDEIYEVVESLVKKAKSIEK